jgi:trimethylamine--corrinoid protein Co-methyltransferase
VKADISCKMPAYELLNEQALEVVEAGADSILENVGIEFRQDAEVLALWQGAGARVAGERVWLPRGMARELVQASAPRRFVQHARNPARSVTFGGGQSVYAPAYGSPHIHGPGQKRAFSGLEDLRNFIKLTYLAPELQHGGGLLCVPNDLPDATSHLQLIYSHLRYSDKPFMGAVGTPRRAEDTLAMGRLVFGAEFFENHACTLNLFNPNSPLVFLGPVLGALKLYARHGQALLITSFPMAGMTGPVTPGGCLALMLAEGLAGLALAQLLRPGVAVMLGAFMTPFSMRSTMPVFGAVESHLLMFAAAALARRLRVPFRADGAVTSSKRLDAQAGAESACGLQAAMLSGADFVLHAAGWLENGRVMSYEKFIMDRRCLAALMAGLGVTEVGSPPEVANAGHLETVADARAEWQRLLADYQAPAMDPALDEALRALLVAPESPDRDPASCRI